jgi:two-component system sensor histidine kinase MtrB
VTPRLRAFAVAVRHRWRRSLQTRVVATTLVLSGTVSLLLGALILHQVRDGLLGSATRSAQSQLESGANFAQEQFDAQPRSGTNALDRTAFSVVQDLSSRGSGDYSVVLLPSSPGLSSFVPEVAATSIPEALKQSVDRQNRVAWTYSSILNSSGGRDSALAIGAPIQAGTAQYQLYFVVPLTREASTLHLVERTM